ncbi:hypothetical protein F2Q68_00031832 [Brassica cretica]|uniref:Amine oxidase domain-containing protein n=1 Tax=Brassica cretica TaxID=69181 RepID=A0A8S9GGG0_BRACR|nr:hypothetical protein F2Q68_00031832 [Brassica cretica]
MRVAVIGGGISGLGSAYVLAKEYGIEEVVLFEKEESLGGHAKTVRFDDVDFDIGFIVFNTVPSISFPIPSQSLARHEVPLSLLSAHYSMSQNSGMLNVEACSPLPTAALLLPNARLIHVE